tara:strand:- start:479 stop:697 length:219 start_codon:yes stop_codon:yes gene_type:complete
LKTLCNFSEADDGIFWMCFADFQYYFSRFQICKYKDDYNFESVNIGAENSAKEYELITMTITQAGEQTVSLS